MNAKRHVYVKLIVLLSLALLFGYGCGGGGGSSADNTPNQPEGEPPIQSDNVFYSNPTDGRVLKVAGQADGSTYTYNGETDSAGDLSKLTSVVVEDPEIEGELVYLLDDDGNPKTIYTPESIFEIEQISDSEVRLTAMTDSGEFQVSIPLEVVADTNASASAAAVAGDSARAVQSAAAGDNANMQVTLTTRCGKAVEDAFITMELTPPIDGYMPVGTHIGNGRYVFNVPSTVDPKLDMLKNCDGIAKKINEFCGKYGWVASLPIDSCEDLAKTASFFGDSAKQKVNKYCRPALLKHLPKIKELLCEGEAAADIEKVCRWDVILAEPAKTHSFALSITVPGGGYFSTEPVAFSPTEPSEWNLESPFGIVLEKFYIVPASPKSTEWYTAYASMVCPDPDNGTTVTLSVEGSDGLRKSTEEVMTVDSTISIDIPPANNPEEPVTDKITVTAEGMALRALATEDRTWSMVVNRSADENYVETQKYYVFKRSGTGFRKMWGGYAEKRTGYDYFYLHILPSEVAAKLAEANKFDEFTANACASTSPAICPCPTFPDIWETGNVELVGSFDTAAEMDPYRCDTYQFDPGNVICTQWDVDTDPKYWDDINAICGN